MHYFPNGEGSILVVATCSFSNGKDFPIVMTACPSSNGEDFSLVTQVRKVKVLGFFFYFCETPLGLFIYKYRCSPHVKITLRLVMECCQNFELSYLSTK